MIAIADTNALIRLLSPSFAGHREHADALTEIEHLVVSPLVIAELDYMLSRRSGVQAALAAGRFIETYAARRKFSVPDVAPHLSTALAVADGYRDADGGKGVGLTDAMNVALAAAYGTDVQFTSDRHFRMIRPLTGHTAFRLLPEDR
ncbi:PIN domain-containing protein [Streptomyces sp. N35]|uniref:PIN domain-containing protein n=1 Tax=Streptomyces sp. N35 TaxID=2795730 RepID=UPI0018F3F993|nr:PIN domain-containing protein [Streptomyces sp. N35]